MSNRVKVVSVLSVLAVILAGVYLYYFPRGIWFNAAFAPPVRKASQLTPFQKAVLLDLDRQMTAGTVYADGYYTGGDPPPHVGVCTDVVISAYRAAGVNLHKLVSADIAHHRSAYNIAKPDPNIDYRRCRNLQIFFQRHALSLPRKGTHAGWQPGDIVIWSTAGKGNPDHIGVIANHLDAEGVPTVVHHWPGLLVCEMDWLYRFQIVGHFRWPNQHR